MTKVYSMWHTYLSSLSLHRKREYEMYCAEAGLETHAIPKMCETRFRMNLRLAEWMEKDDRCLYLCATRLKDDVNNSNKKDVTEAETLILKEFLGNYVIVRLTNKFFLNVSKPVIRLLDYFEAEDPIIYKRWDMIAELFHEFLAKFMKKTGIDDDVSVTELMKIDFTDTSLHLSDSDIYLGGRVESFLEELGLNRRSIELKSWLTDHVRPFYIEALQRMVKYFKPSLSSRTLQNMDVLNPKSFFAYNMDELKHKWAYVAKKFPAVIPSIQIPELLGQVAKIRLQKKVKEATLELTPTEFYHELSKIENVDSTKKYCLVPKLALALLTAHNSGSSSERDISIMVRAVLLLKLMTLL